MGAVPLAVLAHPEEMAQQEWPQTIPEEQSVSATEQAPGHTLIVDLQKTDGNGQANVNYVVTESENSSTHSSVAPPPPAAADPAPPALGQVSLELQGVTQTQG